MTCYPHREFDEYVLLEIEIRDRQTGSNWAAKMQDTEYEICRLWIRSEPLLEEAGFVLGWRPDGIYRGSIDLLVLVREAAERNWIESFKKLHPKISVWDRGCTCT